MEFESHRLTVLGEKLIVFDHPGSNAAEAIALEINSGEQDFGVIGFEEGDCVLEIGAHIGIVAMTPARKYRVKVLAFEPMPENARAIRRNIAENRLESLIEVIPKAVTADGRSIRMIGNLKDNSGGATACLTDMYPPGCASHDDVPSVAINDVFSRYLPEGRIKLVKIDCEGSEHEILNAIYPENLKRIDYLRGEFHLNSCLEQQGYSVERTFARCAAFIDPSRISIKRIKMCE